MKPVPFSPRPSVRVLALLAAGAWSATAQAAPLDLDFGIFGTSIHNVGAVDVGVNIVRAGNLTATGVGTPSRITFSVPVGLQLDRLTVTFGSYQPRNGAFLRPEVWSPNDADFPFFNASNAVGVERDFTNLSIVSPSAVTVNFPWIENPSVSGSVEHTYALRMYVSAIPEPATAALFAAGLAGLLVAAGKRRREARQSN